VTKAPFTAYALATLLFPLLPSVIGQIFTIFETNPLSFLRDAFYASAGMYGLDLLCFFTLVGP
jgi:hypothetical protein